MIQTEGTHQGGYRAVIYKSRAQRHFGFGLFRNTTQWALLKIVVCFSTDTHTSKYCLHLVKSNSLVLVTCNCWSVGAEILFG